MALRGSAMDQEGQYATAQLEPPATPISESPPSNDEVKKLEENNVADVVEGDPPKPEWKPDYRFWCILASLGIGVTMAGVENTIVVTALPFIIEDLGNGKTYVWIANVHLLTGSAVLPLFSQLANVFGRRYLTLFAMAIYILGSGLSGGASTENMLLAGRGIQGAGGQGLIMMTEIIISDLVPLAQRANYMGIVLGISGVAIMAGPVIGGAIVEYTTWRWIFYINLPTCGLAFIMTFIFLHVKWNRDEDVWTKLRRIDLIGNFILIGSTTSVLLALTWAGTIYPWSSANILVPFIVGLVGLVAFLFYESLPRVKEPLMPLRLFATWTSLILYVNTFLCFAMTFWMTFFLPIYFQGVQRKQPSLAAVLMLPMTVCSIPTIVIAGIVVGKWGRYKWIHVSGFVLWTLGMGMLSLLRKEDSAARYVCLQLPAGFAMGFLVTILLPAFQAGVPEKDQAAATGSWTFIRSFSMVWGIAIAGAVFNQYVSKYGADVTDPALRAVLTDGDAFSKATKDFVDSIPEPARSQVQSTFERALEKVFQVGIAFSGVALVLACFEKDIKMRTELETEFGLEDRKSSNREPKASV